MATSAYLGEDVVTAGINASLSAGSVDPAVVAIEARRGAETSPVPVVAIGAGFSRFDRPAPSITAYDDLLGA